MLKQTKAKKNETTSVTVNTHVKSSPSYVGNKIHSFGPDALRSVVTTISTMDVFTGGYNLSL